MYFGKVVPKIGGLFSGADAYEYLPRSVAYLPPADELSAMIENAGFSGVQHTDLTLGLSQVYTATRRP